jgi:hypothetical protein
MMAEVIAFPPAEKWVVAFLKSRSERDGRKVATKAPSTGTRYTRVSRVGGAARDLVTDSPMILVECFADDGVTAEADVRVDRALMMAAARLSDDVTRVQDVGGPSFLPDPDTHLPRYQFTVQLDMRGTAL